VTFLEYTYFLGKPYTAADIVIKLLVARSRVRIKRVFFSPERPESLFNFSVMLVEAPERRVWENNDAKEIFGLGRAEVIGERRRLHDKSLRFIQVTCRRRR
jgi:hypothetical protein